MTIVEYEYSVLKSVRKDMFKATDRDGVNTVYRQARVWNRFHRVYAKACSYEKYVYLNSRFKQMRREALGAIHQQY
jgi:hypothetical protein